MNSSIKSIRSSRSRRPRRSRLIGVEQLEGRTLLSTVSWINPSSGDWSTPSNWSTGALPGPSDDVVIDQPGITVTHTTGSDSVNSVTSQDEIDLTGGSLSFAASSAIESNLSIQSGSLAGTGNLTVSGLLTLSNGFNVSLSGTVNVQGGMAIEGGGGFNAVIINNLGNAVWSSGTVGISGGAVFNNEAGATFNVECDGAFNGDSSTAFNNYGTFTKSVGTASTGTVMALPFNDDGVLNLNAGSLTLGYYSINTTATSTGSIVGAPGTSLTFYNTPQVFTPGSSIDVPNVEFAIGSYAIEGNYEVSGNTSLPYASTQVSVVGTTLASWGSLDVHAGSFDLSPTNQSTVTLGECTVGGQLSGAAGLTVTGGLTWSGEIDAGGAINALGGMSITGGYGDGLNGRTVNNYAAAIWYGGGLNANYGAVFNNLAGATFDVEGAGSFTSSNSGAPSQFNNLGTLTQSVGSSTTYSEIVQQFNNSGTIDVQQGNLVLGDYNAPPVTNSGNVAIEPGTSLGVFGDYQQTAGTTSITIGSLVASGSISILSGTLAGVGTVSASAVTNSGSIIPGGVGSLGKLNINGSYTQTVTGSLDVEIGVGGSDLLAVSGSTTLAGSVIIADLSSTALPLANVFTVMTFPSAVGTFTAYNGLGINGGETVTPTQNPTSLTLAVAQVVPPPATLSGVVFSDFNNDGQVDFGEHGISGVPITLTGTNDLGQTVSLSQTTDSAGTYVFLNLRPGTYTITETQQPTGYTPGIVTAGTGGGSVSGSQITVVLSTGLDAMNNNFGEQSVATGGIRNDQTAGIGFWNNKNGQALIKALNGGVGTQLGNWLAATFPHMFGANAGSDNLFGDNNAAVAAFFQKEFVIHGVKLDAQVLATALSVYVTNATLDNTGVGKQYDFIVAGNGVGTSTFNVGNDGAAFGVANCTKVTVMDLLLAVDSQAVNGILYNGNDCKRNMANEVFSEINEGEDD